jgi:hypothetical protein
MDKPDREVEMFGIKALVPNMREFEFDERNGLWWFHFGDTKVSLRDKPGNIFVLLATAADVACMYWCRCEFEAENLATRSMSHVAGMHWNSIALRARGEGMPPPLVDPDLHAMTVFELRTEVAKLREGIRRHRDCSGHDLCWFHPELWNLLPERNVPTPEVPPLPEFVAKCVEFRLSLEKKALDAAASKE